MKKSCYVPIGLLLLATALPARAQARLDYATLWLSGDDLEVQAAVSDTDDVGSAPARDLRVQVWHGEDDEATYGRGDALEVYFRTNQDLYVVVYRIDADGYVEVLWPISRYDDGFVYGGHDYVLPPDGSSQRLRVSTNKGVEYLEAIASRYPFDLRDLGIDFRFGQDEGERYDYAVDGDPFLAVNDVNYAITGLEEDVDYVVTDFSHYYVESHVEHARYACRQCHVDDYAHHPYEQECTQVTIRYDFGWYDSWYIRYGWYPIYYDPYYAYWDPYWGRPYYYWNYPIYYRWPNYHYTYCRDYPVYYYDGPVRTRTNRNPLYQRDGDGRGITDLVRRDLLPTPRSNDDAQRTRIAANRPSRVTERDLPRLSEARSEQRVDGRRTGPSVRGGERTAQVGERRLSSLPRPSTDQVESRRSTTLRSRDDSKRETPRNWTRPVVRNRENRTLETQKPRLRERDSTPRESTQRERPTLKPREREKPDRDRSIDRPRVREKTDEGRSVDRPREIRRPDPPREQPRVEPRKVEPRRVEPRSEPRRVEPRRDPPKSESKPAPRDSKGGGGGSSSDSRGRSSSRSGDRGRG